MTHDDLMSDAIKKLHDYLAKSPSVVYPEDVLAYLPAIEAENAKLRELISSYWRRTHTPIAPNIERDYLSEMREMGVEVD